VTLCWLIQSASCYCLLLRPLPNQGPTNGPKLFTYTGMAYVDDSTGITGVRGLGSWACVRVRAACMLPDSSTGPRLRVCLVHNAHIIASHYNTISLVPCNSDHSCVCRCSAPPCVSSVAALTCKLQR
jgi:hypothetical protein